MSEAEPIPQQIISSTDIGNYTLSLMEGDVSFYLRDTVVWLYGELFRSQNEDYVILACEHLPKLVAYIQNPFNDDFFKEALSTIKTISAQDIQQAKDMFIKEEVVKKLENYISLETDLSILHLVLAIYINLVYDSNAILKQITEGTKCFEKLEGMLVQIIQAPLKLKLKENKLMIIEIIRLLITIIETNPKVVNKIIRDTKIPKLLSTIFFEDIKLNEYIIRFFCRALDYGNKRVKTELIRFNMLDILCISIDPSYRPEIIKISLEGLRGLLEHFTSFFQKKNIIKEQMIKINAESMLEQICTNINDPEISQLSNEILQVYFTKI
jgi:hypothetical protein